jgi:hypothetical protein
MKFMLLLYGDESQWEGMSAEEAAADMGRWEEFTNELVAAGAMVSGEALEPTKTAKVLRVERGERVVTDGPFAETKEQLGGFYVVDCASMEEALEWAAKLPSADKGATEVRPVPDYEAVAAGGDKGSAEAQS